MPEQCRLVLTILGCIVASGFGDAYGFIHSAKVWQNGHIDLTELGKSAAGFAFGVAAYWFSIRFFDRLGITFAETQTLVWFACTIIGVAVLNGKFAHWAMIDQAVAVCIFAGVGWLMFRTA